MPNVIVIKPAAGEDGVCRFLSHIRRKWLFWHEPVLCCDVNEAFKVYSDDDANALAHYVSGRLKFGHVVFVADTDEIERMKQYRFFVIEKNDGKNVSYYSHDEIRREGRVAKPVPQYVDDIMEADFLKSADMAAQTINSIRQATKNCVRARVVHLTIKNNFTVPCVLFVLKNKQTGRVRYLKGYDIDGKSSDRLYFVDSMDKAWKVTIPMAVKVVEDIHQKHKAFIVETHIYDGNDIAPSKFRYKKTPILSDFKFKRT